MILEQVYSKLAKPDRTILEHSLDLKRALEEIRSCHYISDSRTYELIQEACMLHDLGKVNEEFQRRIKSERKLKFDDTKEVQHNVLSAYFLPKEKFTGEEYAIVMCAILEHHNYGNAIEIMETKSELIQAFLQDFQECTSRINARRLRQAINQIRNQNDAIFVKGMLIKCDYAASGRYVAEYPNDFLVAKMQKLLLNWQRKKPSCEWNAMQKFCFEHHQENVIVIAQTGMGKTEGGLRWINNSKGFFILPIRTAINAMFHRIREKILENERIEERLAILHSESLTQYDALEEVVQIDSNEYEGRGKALSLPLSVCTMDQLFDFVFKYQGYELKLATFSYSKLVIDEIQMYSPDVLAYLIFGIKEIVKRGGKVAILTATLAPFIEDLLKPITFARGEFVNESLRHNVKVMEEELSADAIATLFTQNQKSLKSNKILVVCNTIKKAQSLYQELKSILPENKELHMLHSRFIKKDRERLEQEILQFAGSEQATVSGIGIWISTSVVEASLDIDFDFLLTELQDINSLLQRLGRCNRLGLKSIKEPNCYVFTKIPDKYLKRKNNSVGFIDETIYQLSLQAVKELRGIISETKKLEVLNRYFTTDKLKDSYFLQVYSEAYRELELLDPFIYEKKEVRLRNILSELIIPSPVYRDNKEYIDSVWKEITDQELEKKAPLSVYNKLLPFCVSVPLYEYKRYMTSVRKGKAMEFPNIRCGKMVEIPIVECKYDEMGYQSEEYENAIREANVW